MLLDSKKLELYSNIAECIAELSNDPKKKVGCVIMSLNTDQVLSSGFNQLQHEYLVNNPELLDLENRDTFLNLVTHAEVNAIKNLNTSNIHENDILIAITTLSPCVDCLKLLATNNVKTIYYMKKHKTIAEVEKLAKILNITLVYYNLYDNDSPYCPTISCQVQTSGTFAVYLLCPSCRHELTYKLNNLTVTDDDRFEKNVLKRQLFCSNCNKFI